MSGVYERSSPPSPYWQFQFVHRGVKVRESSKVVIGTTKTERKTSFVEATNLADKLRADIDARVDGKFTQGTLGQAVDLYFDKKLLKSKPVIDALARKVELTNIPVVRNFKASVRRIYGAFSPTTVMEEITSDQITRWAEGMEESGKKVSAEGKVGEKTTLRGEGLAPGSVNAYLRVLSAVLNFAHERRQLVKVPTITWLDDPTAKDEVKCLTDDEVEAVLGAARAIHTRYERVLQFAFNTGARKTEMFALTWDKIDLAANGVARVSFTAQTKRGKLRQVPLPEGLRGLLLAMKAEQKLAGYTGNRVFAFKRANGIWEEPTSMNSKTKAIQEASGVAEWTLHVCRHTYASRLLRRGMPLVTVRDLLGHSDIETTSIYAHLEQTNLDQAAAILNQDWSGGAAAAAA